jgi:nucleotide-binding universal stress UspA family protein
MALKDLLVSIDASDAGNARMGLAMRLARRHRARLIGYYVSPTVGTYDLPVTQLGAVPALVPLRAPDTEHAGDVAEIMAQRFSDDLRLNGLEGTWILSGEDAVRDVSSQLRVCDLAVLGQIDPDRPVRDQGGFHPEDVILQSGRPGLVVPYIGGASTLGTRVLIGWDGSREASRALHEALPLIEPEAAVTVLSIDSGEAAGGVLPSAEMAAAHLRRHGIEAKAEHAPSLDLAIADIILARAADIAADLIVSGAYGHSRLRESLLGGTSRSLFERMTAPVLMSH